MKKAISPTDIADPDFAQFTKATGRSLLGGKSVNRPSSVGQ